MSRYRCSSCKIYYETLEGNFNKNKSRASGYSHICKTCHKKQNKKWKKNHPVKYKELTDKHNKKRDEKQKDGQYYEAQKKYREEHQEEINAKQRDRRYFERLGETVARMHRNLYYVDPLGDWMHSNERLFSKIDQNENNE